MELLVVLICVLVLALTLSVRIRNAKLGSFTKTIKVYNKATGELVQELQGNYVVYVQGKSVRLVDNKSGHTFMAVDCAVTVSYDSVEKKVIR